MSEVTEVTMQEKMRLCGSQATLNGKPARISGYRRRFATVTQSSSGLSAEWSWQAVQRVVSKGGHFES
jgi:hypothetical protein